MNKKITLPFLLLTSFSSYGEVIMDYTKIIRNISQERGTHSRFYESVQKGEFLNLRIDKNGEYLYHNGKKIKIEVFNGWSINRIKKNLERRGPDSSAWEDYHNCKIPHLKPSSCEIKVYSYKEYKNKNNNNNPLERDFITATINFKKNNPSCFEYIKREVPKKTKLNESQTFVLAFSESSYNNREKSIKGARGMFQILPNTASGYGVENPNQLFNCRINTDVFIRYVNSTPGQNPSISDIIAHHNGGPETLKESKDCKNLYVYQCPYNMGGFSESQKLIYKVQNLSKVYPMTKS